jgi:hypothetical protein
MLSDFISFTCYRSNGKDQRSNVSPSRRVVVVGKKKEGKEEREKPTIEDDE